MSGTHSSDDNLQWARSKDRVLSLIALNYRSRMESGELLQPENLREDFEEDFKDCVSLDEVWRRIGEPIRQCVHDAVERPSVNVDLGGGKSWKQYDQRLLDYLDRGEVVALPETGLVPRYGPHASQNFSIT